MVYSQLGDIQTLLLAIIGLQILQTTIMLGMTWRKK